MTPPPGPADEPASSSTCPRSGCALDTLTIAALRQSAALVHAAPALRLRVRDGARVLLTVAAPSPLDEPPNRWLTPCTFRSSVADAWQMVRGGHPIGLTGLLGDAPAIDVGVPAGGSIHEDGVYRWPVSDTGRWQWAVATTGDVAVFADVVRQFDGDPRTRFVDELRLVPDPMLDTVVALGATAADTRCPAPVAALLHDMVVRHAVESLLLDTLG